MKSPITLEAVQQAIANLQQQGERISRRNVLAITGGGMSTVHRLMIQVEEIDAQKALAAATGLSASLLVAIKSEIDDKVRQVTQLLNEQIQGLKQREQEALDSLSQLEDQAEDLTANLQQQTEERWLERSESAKAQTIADHTIAHLQKTLASQQESNRQLTEKGERLGMERARNEHQLAASAAHAMQIENQWIETRKELEHLRNQYADAEKRAAVAKQKAADLREALMKAENRIAVLEEKLEGGPLVNRIYPR